MCILNYHTVHELSMKANRKMLFNTQRKAELMIILRIQVWISFKRAVCIYIHPEWIELVEVWPLDSHCIREPESEIFVWSIAYKCCRKNVHISFICNGI